MGEHALHRCPVPCNLLRRYETRMSARSRGFMKILLQYITLPVRPFPGILSVYAVSTQAQVQTQLKESTLPGAGLGRFASSALPAGQIIRYGSLVPVPRNER